MYELTIGFFNKLIEMIEPAYNFLFSDIDLGFLGLGKISVWAILGSTAFTAVLVAWVVKKITPLA